MFSTGHACIWIWICRKPKGTKNPPLFEQLQQLEKDLKNEEEAHVSWNELHRDMLKRYKQKYPNHGLNVQDNDEYDEEFKELLKKHAINADDLKKQQ